MIKTDQKYSYGPGSTLYRPGSTLYRPGSTLYSPWGFPDGPRNTLSGSRSTLYCPGSTLEVGVGFLWLDGGGLGSFTSLTKLMRGVYKRRALAPFDFFSWKSAYFIPTPPRTLSMMQVIVILCWIKECLNFCSRLYIIEHDLDQWNECHLTGH